MISKAYYKYFIEHHACDDRFVRMAQAMGMPEATKPEDSSRPSPVCRRLAAWQT